MRPGISWLGDQAVDGVVERSFRVAGPAGPGPGVLWLPAVPATPPPLVLLGPGGSGHKKTGRIVEMGRWFAGHAGLAAVAIDGPYHGDRVPTPLPAARYQARIAEVGLRVVLDRMAEDWQVSVDAIASSGLARGDQLAYLGMSMGTRFGLPTVAAMGDRFRCAVFGKFGLRQCAAMHAAMAAPDRVAADARRIVAPTLFHLQYDDEVFPRQGQHELFDLLGCPDKHLIGFDGPHGHTPPAAIARWRDFITGHLVVDG